MDAEYDKGWRTDILMFAYRLVRANQGSPRVENRGLPPIIVGLLLPAPIWREKSTSRKPLAPALPST
jgi:hypothetical protein